jgi:hypothetical protein
LMPRRAFADVVRGAARHHGRTRHPRVIREAARFFCVTEEVVRYRIRALRIGTRSLSRNSDQPSNSAPSPWEHSPITFGIIEQ